MTQQADDEPPQAAGDGRKALLVGACTVAALVVAAGIGTVLVLQSHGSIGAKRLGTVDVMVDSRPSAPASHPASPIEAAPPAPAPSRSQSPSESQSSSSTPATTLSPAPSTAAGQHSGPLPALGFGPLTIGTYTINRTIATTSNLALTLTQITVASGGTVTIDVSYHNTGPAPLGLGCGGALDSAAVNVLTRSDGKTYQAAHSYCSDNPNASFTLAANGSSQSTSQSYAVFTGVTGQNNAFEFTWQSGQNITGSVQGVIL